MRVKQENKPCIPFCILSPCSLQRMKPGQEKSSIITSFFFAGCGGMLLICQWQSRTSPKSLSLCLRMQILYMCNIMKTNACHQLPVFHHQTLQERRCATKTAADAIYLDRGFIYKRWKATKMCIRMYSNKWGNIMTVKTFKLSKSIMILIKWK